MKPYRAIIGVMGSGEDASQSDIYIAESLGAELACQSFLVICGGRAAGVMKAVAKGVKSKNGISVGILPGHSVDGASEEITIPLVTGMGNARNNINSLSSQCIIAIGCTAGTLSEIALSIKNKKRIILLNQTRKSKAFFESLHYTELIFLNSVSDTMHQLNTWFPLNKDHK